MFLDQGLRGCGMKSLRRSLSLNIKNWFRGILRYLPKPPVYRFWRSFRSVLKKRPRKVRRLKAVNVIAVAIVFGVALVLWRYSIPSRPVYYVAYVGRNLPFF